MQLETDTTVRGAAPGLRILWLKTELLHPVDKGGKIRTIEMLKRLKQQHRITYLTLDDGTATQQDRSDAAQYCHELICIPFRAAPRGSLRFFSELLANVFSALPYAISRYRSAEMRGAVAAHVRSGTYDLVVADFLVSAVNVADDIGVPVVLFQHNVEAMIWQRHVQNQRNPLARLYFAAQWRRMAAFERSACAACDAVIAVSDDDCEAMRRDYGIARVSAVPTGVDTDYFRPSGAIQAKPRSLVFTGSMDWMPNEDAIRFFVDDILPRIAQKVPDVSLVVVGRNPSGALREIARTHAGIVVTGRVPDVRPYIEEAACFIVPIRIGGGTRLKIYEAMAMERPVVSTTIGAEGLPIVDGADLLLADTPEDFANAVVRLLQDDALAQRIGAQAATTVRARFGWDGVAARFTSLLQEALDAQRQNGIGGGARRDAEPRGWSSQEQMR
jgi:polysaccharide biosynthesis protein PslH